MFKNTMREVLKEVIAEGGITTEDVKLVKNDNLENQRQYNADNNKEIRILKETVLTLSAKLEMMEKFLGVEAVEGSLEFNITEPSYKKVKKGKK